MKYTLYKELNKHCDNLVFNGFLSGIITSLITHPIDYLKVHKQMFAQHDYNFYRGYSKTFLKIGIGSSMFFPLNDMFKKRYDVFTASLLSAVISTLVMHPFDYMKTRQIYNLPFYQGLNIFKYYKGLSINLLRIVPHFCIVMNVIHLLENM
jgi:hypothetical protein